MADADRRERRVAELRAQAAGHRTLLEGPPPMVRDPDPSGALPAAAGYDPRNPLKPLRAAKKRPYKPEHGRKKAEHRRANARAAARHAARAAVQREVASGRMVRGACRDCGATPTEAHHYDPDRPLAVVWLCKTHHDAITHAALPVTRGALGKRVPGKSRRGERTW